MSQHICKKCGKEYQNYRRNSVFCSVKCRASFQHDEFLLKSKQLIKKRFGRLTVLDATIENGKTKCLCLCDCGNKIKVNSDHLKNGHTLSCGCYQKEKALKDNAYYLEKHRRENHIENTNLSRIDSLKSKNNKSGVKGVYWHSYNNKWTAKLTFQKKTYRKEFKNFEDAVNYRKELEEKYFKPILDKYKTE